jgi:transposase
MGAMPRTYTPLSSKAAQHIQTLMKKAESKWEYRRLQCVSLRQFGMQAQDVAKITGLHPGSVRLIWMKWQRHGEDVLLGERRGQARGRARWTSEEERTFMQPFLDAAERGKLTTVKEMHRAHCEHLGKRVDSTVTYRLLWRHGWRKVVPRQQHPKTDKAAQETFKLFFPHTGYVGTYRRSALWAPFPVDVLG